MKTKNLIRFLVLLVLTVALSLQPATFLNAAPLDTGFTYQGRLNDGDVPANGAYDFRFAIYEALTGSGLVAGPITNSAVTASNGLFTVTLDFGGGVFSGEARWLEVAVRTHGSGAFSTLSPRQPLTPTPYALYAPSAGTAVTASSAAAGSISNAAIALGAVDSSRIADGSILSADLGTTLALSTFWRLNGNAGTTAGTQFVGTTDGQPLEFRVNTQRAMRLEPGVESPNVVAGHPGNAVSVGTEGAVIGGGGNLSGANVVMGRFGTIGGGVGNLISTNASDTTIGGGWLNVISPLSAYATIGGGSHNTAGAVSATVSGGYANTVLGQDSVVAGGYSNSVASLRAAVVGGYLNHVEPGFEGGFIGSGYGNRVAAHNSSVIGGYENSIMDSADNYLVDSVIGGGLQNQISGDQSVIGGGMGNTNAGYRATIAGGSYNRVAPGYEGGFIGGGYGNRVTAANSSVVGGYGNSITNLVDGFIGGGLQNQISANHTVIGGGHGNTNESDAATIGGGSFNRVEPGYTGGFIGGGYGNRVAAHNSSVAGGYENTITNLADGFIGGGKQNYISANHTVIGGGLLNTNAGPGATLGGGNNNWIGPAANDAFIGGGVLNRVESYRSAMVGGERNVIQTNADYAVIAGGIRNGIGTNADFSAIGGGSNNTVAANATFAVIPGGLLNAATNFAFAAGRRAKANHSGAFVWADATDADVSSTNANSVTIRAAGGYRLFSSTDTSAPAPGVYLAPGSSSWTTISDRAAKKDFAPVDTVALLNRLVQVPVLQWHYQWEETSVTPHLGPMAQDFKAAFYPGRDDKCISTLEFDGVALAAIQGLNQKVESGNQEAEIQIQELRTENAELKAQNHSLNRRLERLEQVLLNRQNGGAK